MLFELETAKTPAEIDAALRAAAANHKFGVLTVHDLQQTMKNKGVDFEKEVWVYEVCNPFQAKAALTANTAISTALPCRISVYRHGAGYRLSTILPTEMMKAFPGEGLSKVASEVEATLIAMMKETA